MTEDLFADRLAALLRSAAYALHKVEAKRLVALRPLVLTTAAKWLLASIQRRASRSRVKGKGLSKTFWYLIRLGRPNLLSFRVVAEVKYGAVNTHEVIVYSEKADRIRRSCVYPYVRYGFVLGGMFPIPGRVLRLGAAF